MLDYDKLSKIFSALANPTRLRILDKLRFGKATVSELAEPFSMSLPGITNHLKVLEKAGLIFKGQEAQWRPTQLAFRPLKDIDLWLNKYREIWDVRLTNLDNFMKKLREKENE